MEQNNTNRKSRKTVVVFLLILAVSLLLGVCLGLGIAFAEDAGLDLAGVFRKIEHALGVASYWINLAGWILAGIVCCVLYRKAKAILAAWDGENEAEAEKADDLLSVNIMISNAAIFLNLFCIAVFPYVFGANIGTGMFVFAFVTLIGGLLLGVVLQRMAVNLVKKLNPEKHGDILDPHFQKEWESGFDEMERAQSREAAFTSFRFMQKLYPVAWCVCVLLNLAAKLGLFAVFAVTVLWAVQNLSYMWKARRLNRHSAR